MSLGLRYTTRPRIVAEWPDEADYPQRSLRSSTRLPVRARCVLLPKQISVSMDVVSVPRFKHRVFEALKRVLELRALLLAERAHERLRHCVTRSERVLDEATVKSRIKVGVPVRVHYAGTGPNMVVDRVILEED